MLNSNSVRELKDEALKSIESAADLPAVEELRVKLLGKKGQLTQLMKSLGEVEAAGRKELGALLNQAKVELESSLDRKRDALLANQLNSKLEKEAIDVTLPVWADLHTSVPGSQHPLSRVQRELERVFTGLGFTVVDGPEAETEYYNFEALNIPASHPARDMQDTIWTATAGDGKNSKALGGLLRTHTSSIQVRALESMKPPIRIVAPGRVFRYERVDASHAHTFYQMEGMMIDKNVSVGHVIYFMKTLLREIFGSEQKIRLRPGYFPFVEPGFELDIWFQGRWMELLPCGLVHPRVLEMSGIDPKEWQGFAFGLGLSRLVMSRYQVDDIRWLQGGDLRFLRQFA